MSLFSKLRNCAIFFVLSFPIHGTHTARTHTHKLKAYKAATHTLTDNCGTIFNICARRLKICNIFYLFLLHKVLRHKIFFAGCHFCRSCCCCCVTAFIPQCVWLCVCAYVLAFYDPIWPPSAAYVFVAIFCLFQSLSFWAWFCVGFMNYIDFYAVAYYFCCYSSFVLFFFLLFAFYLLFFAACPSLLPCLFWLP